MQFYYERDNNIGGSASYPEEAEAIEALTKKYDDLTVIYTPKDGGRTFRVVWEKPKTLKDVSDRLMEDFAETYEKLS